MKSVLISIRPKWCELIAAGKKTVEVRKTRPKLKPPFKCYIYCTKPSKAYQTICDDCMVLNSDELYRHPKQGIKHGDSIELIGCDDEYSEDNFLNGKVIGEFVCDCITGLNADNMIQAYYNNTTESCMSDAEIMTYANGKKLYYWHISDLVIYDKPRKLSKFIGCTYPFDCCACDYWDDAYLTCTKPIRPPQSWCYVEGI